MTPSCSLQALGLTPYEAKVLAAIADLGEGDSITIAAKSGVPRTSIYRNCGVLVDMGVIEARGHPTVWRFRGWVTAPDVLRSQAQERLAADHRSILTLQRQVWASRG